MAPVRIQRSRAKGWKMPENTIAVTRPGPFGNPFNLDSSDHCWTAIAHGFKGDAKGRLTASIAMFRQWLINGHADDVDCGLSMEVDGKTIRVSSSPPIVTKTPPSLDRIRSELRGKNLACWCPLDQPCHADVLLELANVPVAQDVSKGQN